jgi:hypothetical protein
MALIEPLHGLSFALLHLACMSLLGQTVPPGLAATAQAIYGTVAIGAMTSLLTLTSGTLNGHFGASGFWAMAGLCFRALPFIAKLRSVTQIREALYGAPHGAGISCRISSLGRLPANAFAGQLRKSLKSADRAFFVLYDEPGL